MIELRSASPSRFTLLLRSLGRAQPQEYSWSVRVIQWFLLQAAAFPLRPVACTVLPVSRCAPVAARAQLLEVALSFADDASLVRLNLQLSAIAHPFRFRVVREQAYVDGLWMDKFPGAYTLWFSDPLTPRDHVTLLTLPSVSELESCTAPLYQPLPRAT